MSVEKSINRTSMKTEKKKIESIDNISHFSIHEDDRSMKENTNPNQKEFISKKRHLPKAYQVMIDRNLHNKTPIKDKIVQ